MGPMRYERRRERPLSRKQFVARLLKHFAIGGLVILGSLVGGMAGYAYFEGLSWLDAFLNAAMLLGGMGPLEAPATSMGKLFAGVYALYSGLVFLVLAGIVLAPVVHRILHRFHWTDDRQ